MPVIFPLNDAEAAELRRAFDPNVEPTHLPHMAACGGACDQGRKPCSAPDACRLPLRDDEDAGRLIPGAGALVVPVLFTLTVLCIVLAVHLWRSV